MFQGGGTQKKPNQSQKPSELQDFAIFSIFKGAGGKLLRPCSKFSKNNIFPSTIFHDKTGQYKFTDLLKLREVINQKKELLEVLPKKIRDLRRQQKGTQLGHIHEKNRRKRATAEEIQELQSGANIQEALAGGLKTWVQQELHLKEQIMQAQTILDKAMAKHEAIEKINPENLEDSD